MPSDTTVTCDHCGKDLTWTSNREDYCLVLLNHAIPSRGSSATAMAIYPKIKREAYFCSLECLAQWVAPQFPVPR